MDTLTLQEDAIASDPVVTDEIAVTENGFSKLRLSNNILKAVSDMNFTNPSSIQKEAIPQVLSGNDIIAKAPTGSGKTAAFAIPIIEKMDLNPENKSVQALVLCPTRELAIQVHKEFEKLLKYFESMSVVSVYGGQSIDKQLSALRKNPQIIVATPGRLMDHLRRGSIKLNATHTVVLDEADEMLDMGFREDIYTILEETPTSRQTILFSATMAKDIIELTKKFQRSPNIVDVTDNLLNTPNIEQFYFEVSERDKFELVTRLLNLHNINSALIFCNTKSNVDKVVEILKTKGYFADAIHGDMNQSQREKVMGGFRHGSVKILVATDVAGRGIDVKNIEAVFNYDLPRDDEDYIHRVGRTGRAGKSGVSFTFVSKRQLQNLKRIERANGIQINKKEIPTFEEIQIARISNFKNKIKDIINEDDLTEHRANVEAMINDGIDAADIASALLKFYMSKEGKKINKNVVFESLKEESSDRQGRRRSRNRGDRDRDRYRGERSERSESRDRDRYRGERSERSESRDRDRYRGERSERSESRDRDRNHEDRSEYRARNKNNDSERNERNGHRERSERSSREGRDNGRKYNEFQGNKEFKTEIPSKVKNKLAVSIDDMILSVNEINRKEKRKSSDKTVNKGKPKVFNNMNKKSKSKFKSSKH